SAAAGRASSSRQYPVYVLCKHFVIQNPSELLNEDPIRIDEERFRNAEQTVVSAYTAVIVDCVREGKPELVDKLSPCGLPSLVQGLDADDDKFVLVRLPDLLQQWGFNPARLTPLRPEADDYRLADS